MALNRTETYMYPYLSENSDDYSETSFESTCDIKENNNGVIEFEVTYKINNEEINNRVKSKELNVVCEINCSLLRKRIVRKFDSESQKMLIDDETMNFDDRTNVICYLIAAKDIYYSNEKLAGGWKGETIYLQKNNIIGESNLNTLYIHHNRNYGRNSIFNFVAVQSMNDIDPIRVNLDGERIVFNMSQKRFNEFNTLQVKSSSLIISSTVLPIFTQILESMKQNDDDEDDNPFNTKYSNHKWYKIIKQKYESLFKESPKSSNQSSFVRAQLLLSNIIYQTFEYGIVAQLNKDNNTEVGYEG